MQHFNLRYFLFVAIALAILQCLGLGSLVMALEEEQPAEPPAISVPEDMEKVIGQEVVREREYLKAQARSLFERTPLGFDFKTIGKLWGWIMKLPSNIPMLIQHIREQSRLLGLLGSVIVLAFLIAVFYSFIGRKKVLQRSERVAEPLRDRMPGAFYPYFLSLLRIIVASLMPVILLAIYSLIQLFINYRVPWFLLIGKILKLWVIGALVINLMGESLTREIFPITPRYGLSIFRVGRVIALYIIISIAVFWGFEAFQISEDLLALLKFLISLSIVFALLILLLKKNSILSLMPDLPYKSYRVFVKSLERVYYPAILLTFITGLLWCLGYQILCKVLWTKTWAVAGFFLGIMILYHIIRGWFRRWYERKETTDEAARFLYKALLTLLLYVTVTVVLLVTLKLIGLLHPLQRVMSFPVVTIGQSPLSLWTLVKAIFVLLTFLLFSRLLRSWLDYKIYPAIGVDEGLAYAISTFLNYSILAFGLLFALRTLGLDLRVLMVFAGAVGIGIGFGLQPMAANIFSGFTLVFGRRIRKGNWIQVGDTIGAVQEVGLGATRVRTRDNIEHIIPNADLTSKMITNYSLSDPLIRVHIQVGVSYKSNPSEVEKVLLDAAVRNPDVTQRRKPEVWFKEYGDSSLNFELLVGIDVRKVTENRVRSELYFTIFQAFKEAGIEIPFPQRDLHIRSGLSWPGVEPNK
jgi:small-conductance mechanosensitive channel